MSLSPSNDTLLGYVYELRKGKMRISLMKSLQLPIPY